MLEYKKGNTFIKKKKEKGKEKRNLDIYIYFNFVAKFYDQITFFKKSLEIFKYEKDWGLNNIFIKRLEIKQTIYLKS